MYFLLNMGIFQPAMLVYQIILIPRDPGSITETENGFMEAKGPMRFEGE